MDLGNVRSLAIGVGVCLCGIVLFLGFIALIWMLAKRQSSTPQSPQSPQAAGAPTQRLPSASSASARQTGAALHVHIRPDLTESGFRMRVSGVGSTLLGRSPDAGTVLALNEYSGVSRIHARLLMRDGALYVSDLESRNGTWINGHRLGSGQLHELRAGDVLNLGRTRFIVDSVNGESAA